MLSILNKIEFENKCWVGLVDSSTFNFSEEDRIKAVTDIASITTGKLGFKDEVLKLNYAEIQGEFIPTGVTKQRQCLYNRLLTESAGKPSTPFEFIPTFYPDGAGVLSFLNSNEWRKHTTKVKGSERNMGRCYSNLRNDLNCYPRIIHNSNSMDSFKIVVGRVPWKVVSHLRTHRAFSFLVESSRNKRYLNEVEFWYPSWWNENMVEKMKSLDKLQIAELQVDIERKQIKTEEATMELSDRRLVHFAMAAWIEDKNAWNNLFAVRGAKTGTMSITGTTVNHIKTLIES